MEPKEKAKYLVGKMCLNDCTDKNIKKAKQYALISVEEILEHCYQVMKPFWEEVKKEIESL